MSTSLVTHTTTSPVTYTTTTSADRIELQDFTRFLEEEASNGDRNKNASFEERLKSYRGSLDVGRVILFAKCQTKDNTTTALARTVFHKCIKSHLTGKFLQIDLKKTEFFELTEDVDYPTNPDLFKRLKTALVKAGYKCECDLEENIHERIEVRVLELPYQHQLV